MKLLKVLLIILIIIIVFFLFTGKEDGKNEGQKSMDQVEEKAEVEVTLPAFFFEEERLLDDAFMEAEKNNVENVKQNKDGSVTFAMTSEQHRNLLKDLKKDLKEKIDKIIQSESTPSVKEIHHNERFSEFTIIVDEEKYKEGFDGFATLSLGTAGMYYQMFSGEDMDDSEVTIKLENVDTGEVFDKMVYPDALNGSEIKK
ncbi:hypothetical protein [Virgibacillus sp. SK37]|uniref:hypothetical protein n=1 Tax=Virgibacillus sp. SK37 TaxID=403957 RepID=UPI0004D0EB38|nr:hypothetical protein [Virgibacillus sp. SK37]AIF42819.1 hypothetical protein X953_05865 [Virgibacillus sp. SK37]